MFVWEKGGSQKSHNSARYYQPSVWHSYEPLRLCAKTQWRILSADELSWGVSIDFIEAPNWGTLVGTLQQKPWMTLQKRDNYDINHRYKKIRMQNTTHSCLRNRDRRVWN